MRIRGGSATLLTTSAVILCLFRYAVTAEFVGEWELGLASPLGTNSRYEIFPTGPACGYGNPQLDGYGNYRVAVTSALFAHGETCGTCLQVTCDKKHSPECTGKSLNVTVTDQCFSSTVRGGSLNSCGSTGSSIFLPHSIFSLLANQSAALPVKYRRVSCHRKTPIVFQLNGDKNTLQVNVRNVGGRGTLREVWVKPEGKKRHKWMAMSRVWGENWSIAGRFHNHSLSFKLFASGSKAHVVAENAVPASWRTGMVFEKGQFQ